MTQNARLSAVSSRALPEIRRPLPSCADATRCSHSAQTRGEAVAASAVPYRRYLLLEVPGAWRGSALDERHLGPRTAEALARATADASMSVLLIRRPGRQRLTGPGIALRGGVMPAVFPEPRAWALADTSPSAERVLWGSWDKPEDLLDIDLTAPLPASVTASGPQKVVLTCTNGKRDQCCAILGRPVAEVLTTVAGWDTWECTHLGGHRFAATMMLLPTGDMFGRLDRRSAVTALERFDSGHFVLSHYRGRSGQPVPVQAALRAAAIRLGDSRRQAFRVLAADRREAADRWDVLLAHRAESSREVGYRVTVVRATPAPALLSCADEVPKAEVRYAAVSFSPAGR